jgi:hypothetical protein
VLLEIVRTLHVQVDPYSSVCRLSKKVFNTPEPAARQVQPTLLSGSPLFEN